MLTKYRMSLEWIRWWISVALVFSLTMVGVTHTDLLIVLYKVRKCENDLVKMIYLLENIQ